MAFFADGLDRGERVAGALVHPGGDKKKIVVEKTHGHARSAAVRDQVERILSLDTDGSGFPEVGARDPVMRGIQERYPGLRPVLFYFPYEAAARAIIGNRTRIAQAAKTKARMVEELGGPVEVDGKEEHAFPGPNLATADGLSRVCGEAHPSRPACRAASPT